VRAVLNRKENWQRPVGLSWPQCPVCDSMKMAVSCREPEQPGAAEDEVRSSPLPAAPRAPATQRLQSARRHLSLRLGAGLWS